MVNYTHLSQTDRRRLSVFLEMKLSVNEIATKLSRHRSTIYRELNRNEESGVYSLGLAQQKTKERNKKRKQSKLETDGILRDYVITGLKKGRSPDKYHYVDVITAKYQKEIQGAANDDIGIIVGDKEKLLQFGDNTIKSIVSQKNEFSLWK